MLKTIAKAIIVFILLACFLFLGFAFVSKPIAGAAEPTGTPIVYTQCPGQRYGAEWTYDGRTINGTSVDWDKVDAPDFPILTACNVTEIRTVLNDVEWSNASA